MILNRVCVDNVGSRHYSCCIYSPIREHMSYLHQGVARANFSWTPLQNLCEPSLGRGDALRRPENHATSWQGE